MSFKLLDTLRAQKFADTCSPNTSSEFKAVNSSNSLYSSGKVLH